ncbi:integrase catalytic domain-containing protein [Trichonephila clavata]|uniref:Integrase catalytic domain-containing protein n=1 Tax=Trichonephila clavata TaxID=2740835 RepID=A0A8X6LCM2_TRICU|nr:integrase catalytic domain-containing protein [Trichonephila clavata]
MTAEAKRTFNLIMLTVVDATFKAEFFENFSSWIKLKRVVAYCLRFVKNCSLDARKRRKSFLTTAELNEAEKAIVKFIQHDHFSMEVSYLSAGKQLPSSNKLILLTPFYDDFGIIRVGGRLKSSILPESQKHPILLPKTDHVVNLIITDYHLKLLHAGPQLLQAALREKFWILSARDAVRRVVRRCIPCFRNRPRFAEQIMGDLPKFRVSPSSVFQRTGLDFASPFLIRSSKGRGNRNTKKGINSYSTTYGSRRPSSLRPLAIAYKNDPTFLEEMVFRVLDLATIKIQMAHRSKEPLHRRSCSNQARQLTPTTVEIRESHGNVPW